MQISTRIKTYFGLERNVLIMTLARSLKNLGSEMWSGFLPKVLEILGASAPVIGTFGTINSGFAAFYTYLGGALSDRLGRGRAMILSGAVAIAGYLVYALSPVWGLFILGSMFLTASANFDFMGSMAMFGETVKNEKRAVSMAAVGLLQLPVGMIAPPLGGLLIASVGMLYGFRIGVAITIVLTVIAIIIQRKFYKLPPPAAKKLAVNMKESWKAMNHTLRSMLFANCLMAFGAGMYQLFLVLYLMNIVGMSAIQYGLLQSVLLASTTVFAIPISKLADRKVGMGRKPYVTMTFLLTALFPALLIISPSAFWVWPLFVLRGLRQSFDGIRKAMVIDLAGEGERGKVLGLYFFLQSLAVFPASFAAGWLWTVDPKLPFIVGALVAAAGLFVFITVKRKGDEKTI